MEVIGDYTGEGFVGLRTINVQSVEMAKAGSWKTSETQSRSQHGTAELLTVVNNYNLTQNNTSPKSLSALDIQSKKTADRTCEGSHINKDRGKKRKNLNYRRK